MVPHLCWCNWASHTRHSGYFQHQHHIFHPWSRHSNQTPQRYHIQPHCSIILPTKKKREHTRLTVGANLIDYPWKVATPTADLTTAQFLFNSVISTTGACLLTPDIKNFYLNTHMTCPKFIHLKYDLLQQEIVNACGLAPKELDAWIYVRIEKGMHRLPKVGLLPRNFLPGALMQIETTNAMSHQASGTTNGTPSHLA